MYPYYYNPTPTRRRANPIGTGAGIGILAGLGIVGLGMYGFNRVMAEPARTAPSPAPAPGEHELSGVYVPGATLAASPRLQTSQRLPVAITTYSLAAGDGASAPVVEQFPHVTRAEYLVIRGKQGDLIPLEYLTAEANGTVLAKIDELALLEAGIGYDMSGEIAYADGTPDGARATVLKLVCDLSGPVMDSAYDTALSLVRENYAFDEPSGTRDAYVLEVLQEVAPDIDWPNSPESLQVGTPRWRTWMGVALIGQVAYQNHWNTVLANS